ncbi:MAG: DUF1616 domain-containing protein [Dehalococcoidia bacterium]
MNALIALLLGVGAIAVAPWTSPPAGVRMMIGLALVLFLPGYAISLAIEPSRTIAGLARLGWSLALSLCATILTGIGLSMAEIGIDATAWQVSLGGVTVIAAIVALARPPGAVGQAMPSGFRFHWQVLPIAAAIAVLVGAVWYARDAAMGGAEPGFTQLWLLASDPGVVNRVEVGISNQEGAPITYRAVVHRGQEVLSEWPELTLRDGERWSQRVEIPATVGPQLESVEMLLYRADRPGEVYRRVALACQAGDEALFGPPIDRGDDGLPGLRDACGRTVGS